MGEDTSIKDFEMEGLTGFKLREAIFVFVSYTVDPLRNRQTNSQHISGVQEKMKEIK